MQRTQLEGEICGRLEVGTPGHERPRPGLETFAPDARVAGLGDPHGPHGVPPLNGQPLIVSLGFCAAELAQRLEEMEPI